MRNVTTLPEWASNIVEHGVGGPEFPAHTKVGGYAVAYVTDDGALVCAGCVNSTKVETHFDDRDQDGFCLMGFTTNEGQEWDEFETCCICGVSMADQ